VPTRKTVTVVFADVTGSTALGEQLDPEVLRGVMSRWFDEARAALERHGGTVEKFIGDAVMAVFGVPAAHEDDALRAVRAAAELRERLDALNEGVERDLGFRLEVRTGVNTGEVVAGDPEAGHGFVTGDAVNVAARLEQAAAPGEILIGEATYRLVPAAVEAEPVEPLELKGKAEPVSARRLVRVLPGAEAFARRLDAPMVGRRDELALLLDAFGEAKRERACRVATILGEPGIGKSRLAHELVRTVQDEATVLRGRCLPYGEGITFWPLVEILREAVHHEVRARIVELLEGDPDAELIADRLAAAVGETAPGASTDEIFWAARRLFERLARERPLLVVVDDVQWAEETFLDLVEHVAYLSRTAPILLCCLARPELAQTRAGWPGRRVELKPLTGEESAALIDTLQGEELDEQTRKRIEAAAEGNPLFVEQMLAMLGADGGVEVPPTIQALLAARLDALPANARAAAERASVVGQEFWSGAVRALSDADGELGAALLDLVRHELVRPAESTMLGEDAYAFVHLLVRDAAYARIPKEVRADLHEQLASWLEDKDAERGSSHDEIVGYHLEQAARYRSELGRPDERVSEAAGERLAAAGHRANLRGDTPAAVNLLSRAADLLRERDELLAELAGALIEAGEFDRAETVLQEAAESGDELVAARGRVQLLMLRDARGSGGSPEATEAEARAAIETFERHGDNWGLARAWLLLGEVGNQRGWRGEMREGAARSAEHALMAGDPRAEAEALRLYGGALVYGGTPADEGIAQLERILERGDLNRMVEAALIAPLSTLKAMRGDFDEARALLERVRQIYADLGLAVQQARLGFMSSRVERLAGKLETAECEQRRSCELFWKMGERGRYAGIALELAGVLCDLGRLDEAETILTEVESLTASQGDEFLLASVRGKLLAYRGDSAGEALAREAVALAAGTDDYTWRGDVVDNLVATLLALGRREESADALREALDVHRAKGNLVATERAETLLAELAAEPLPEHD
jgi:class 3 adenylate cyclase/tetratricopeptide (TPR) repeat protein